MQRSLIYFSMRERTGHVPATVGLIDRVFVEWVRVVDDLVTGGSPVRRSMKAPSR